MEASHGPQRLWRRYLVEGPRFVIAPTRDAREKFGLLMSIDRGTRSPPMTAVPEKYAVRTQINGE